MAIHSDAAAEDKLTWRAAVHPLLGLYAIVDVGRISRAGLDPIQVARAVLTAKPAALQVRAKELEARELLALLRTIGSLCRSAGVPLVVNDRVDLAVLAGADYVHVGQTDLPVDRVRRVAPGLRVGVSTHSLDQLEVALLLRPAYVAYGPVFPTSSKESPDPCVGTLGLAQAARAAAKAGIPLVAIGGVTLERAPEVARLASAAAVIQALLPDGGGPSSRSPSERSRSIGRWAGP
jgi:thiamine-phosphate pyrophosphorylase